MFRIFTANWRTFAIALGVILVPLYFVTSILSGVAGLNVGFLEQVTNPAAAQAAFESGPDLRAIGALVGVSLLSAIFVNPFVSGVACQIAAEAFEGGTPQPRPALQAAGRRYWALIGVTFLLGLVVLAVILVPLVLIFVGAAAESDGVAILGGFLMVVAFFVALWLGVRLSLLYPVLIVEGVGPVDALRRSYRLVKGRWWRVFGTMLLAALVTGIVAQIAALPFALPGNIFGAAIGVVFVTIGSVIAGIITTPLTANVQTLLYFDGRIRSEGYDLEVMTRDVLSGGERPAPPAAPGQPFG